MPSNQDVKAFRDAVEVGDDSTVSELANEMPKDVLNKALTRCECLVRITGDYQSTREILRDALKNKS